MGKINKETLTYLGVDFQVRLIAQIMLDSRFAASIIPILDANFFNEHMKLVAVCIMEAYEKDGAIPDISSLEFRLLAEINNDTIKKYALKIGRASCRERV